jgi:hypothetical protein
MIIELAVFVLSLHLQSQCKNNYDSLNTALHTGANAICVSGSDVYIAGEIFNGSVVSAAYWLNGVPVNMTVSSTDNTLARSILVAGSDVYVCGDQSINIETTVAIYWENGIPIALAGPAGNSDAFSIFVNGSDLYLTGFNNNFGCYWKNGTQITLSPNSIALSIYVR